ncbi:tRNA 5-methylaminomethyl-2-thiouridine biosynthesis bifunctional protein [Tamilnaduibacter salinus]|uniref:tRNA 5-methylaminomethyl-2-thiouridine biosynthesis bifunctional protein MnmC n=1 Tax=Tamilnaduibacter salinus TaxID=1484056 RepID=A0A2A2I2Q1_9GAMM|nr:bifunctional tRNA (5-methylaminomethyl-2-thiouridine)(34)-methyltransferase MnmD/FAD-dependent 5-carboxymethylaminomethyl-2-thiouridine(34) oxidoreductase MnmC [Tamilnaduibacter salinus]PAV26301.1 bifunctional tRNA (5-methylaminomethyl-2-thiouridine)(34)-methyltransferase MnmD/FAD-dependent 5-carboxymethylaminomethyl-2-thiouridine(34) oxidoreductase MnmC [Tamilnaduibacter salinus]PVY78046.1 tRNA 5-methylaminomethyl-2-thiouridine biosynthesis bifunctional protein [Tamilnaduibacter salinus]
MSQEIPRPPRIETAELDWRDGQPVSSQFGDVYFSRDDGLAETRYVFLKQNRLPERFRALSGGHFVVAETGFGTGLNFLATWALWCEHAPAEATLHFVSVERYPLSVDDLQRALSIWPELADLVGPLANQYPPAIHGLHRLVFNGGRVHLSLYFGDALNAFRDMAFQADAWFLDGFAPACNPDLWEEQLLDAIARHSGAGTSIATFTAVGAVRRALQARGFEMRKVPGFGRKREMLAGDIPVGAARALGTEPVTVIGAGIAGALVAYQLARRGIDVTVLEQGDRPAQGASGNAQGALYIKPGVDYSPETELALHALLYAQRFYGQLGGDDTVDAPWHPTGVLLLATNDQERDRQDRLLARNDYPSSVMRPVGAANASRLAGIDLMAGGLWFPRSGWLNPPALCRRLLGHSRITIRYRSHVDRVEPTPEGERLTLRDGTVWTTSTVILAGGDQTPQWLPGGPSAYRFRPIRGQISRVSADRIATPSTVLCGTGYLCPRLQGQTTFGATFDLHETDTRVTAKGHEKNLDHLETMVAAPWSENGRPGPEAMTGRVGFRATTHDRQPVAGNVRPTCFVLTGLGSKGLAYAPLLSEWIADGVTGQPACLLQSQSQRLTLTRCRHKGS